MLLDDPALQEIMQMNDAANVPIAFDHHERRNGKALHHFDRFGRQIIGPDCPWMSRRERARRRLREVSAALNEPPQVSVGDDPR